jgi:hypothetical protein
MPDYISPGDDEVGAAVRQLVRRGGPRMPFKRPPLPAAPAQPNDAELRSYMGLGVVTFAIGDAADKTVIVEPQESFRGERLVADVGVVGVTNTVIPLLRGLFIGTMPQTPSVEQPAPLSMFRPDATSAELDLQVAYRGTKIQVTVGVSAAPVGAAVVVALGLYGKWIR